MTSQLFPDCLVFFFILSNFCQFMTDRKTKFLYMEKEKNKLLISLFEAHKNDDGTHKQKKKKLLCYMPISIGCHYRTIIKSFRLDAGIYVYVCDTRTM